MNYILIFNYLSKFIRFNQLEYQELYLKLLSLYCYFKTAIKFYCLKDLVKTNFDILKVGLCYIQLAISLTILLIGISVVFFYTEQEFLLALPLLNLERD